MDCPNCNKEMKNKSYWYYGFGSWDMDYPDQLHEKYWCPHCRINFLNDEWTIPDSMIVTEKQLNAGKIIERNTGISMPPPLKKLLSKYIGDYLELSKQCSKEYKEMKEQAFSEWCEENSDWLPEYF